MSVSYTLESKLLKADSIGAFIGDYLGLIEGILGVQESHLKVHGEVQVGLHIPRI